MHSVTKSKRGPGGLGETEREVLSALAALERLAVTADDVVRLLGKKRLAANLFLSRLARKGWLRRLRRGVYAVVPLSSRSGEPVVEDPLALAMELFAPCYISGWTAAEHWDLTEQIFNAVVVYSAKPQRRALQHIGGVTYRVRRVPEEAIFGTSRIWSGTAAIEMATVNRTVIDVLDAPEMGAGGRQMLEIVQEYWKRRDADGGTPMAGRCSIWQPAWAEEASSRFSPCLSVFVAVLVKNVVDELFHIVFAPVRANAGLQDFTDLLTGTLAVLSIP